MEEKRDHELLKAEIERGHYVRAALVAEQVGLPEKEIRDLQCKALAQMAVSYRNAHGAKYLARQYGFSREEVRKILEEFADEVKSTGDNKPLEPSYDHRTGKYLSFEEWMDYYLRTWEKL